MVENMPKIKHFLGAEKTKFMQKASNISQIQNKRPKVPSIKQFIMTREKYLLFNEIRQIRNKLPKTARIDIIGEQ